MSIKLKLILLGLVAISQVFYWKYVILRRHHHPFTASIEHTNAPPHYRILTDGKTWVWEHDFFPAMPSNWFRCLGIYRSQKGAIDGAWYQYNYELSEATNKWEVK